MGQGSADCSVAQFPAECAGPLSFTSVGSDDWPFLARVYADSRAEELAPVPWPEQAKADFLRQQFELQKLHYDTHYQGASMWVVRWEGEPVGRVYVFRGATDIRLMEVAVLRSWRRRGIGRAILTELVAESDRRGIPLSLHVEPLNPIVPFYRALGFAQVEDRGAYVFMRRLPVAPDAAAVS